MAETPASPKRIAFFLPSMAGGGAERVALAGITDLLQRGHEVDLVLISAEGALMPLIPAQVKIFDLKASRIIASLLPLARYFRERKPNAVHALMWPVTIIAIVARWLARSRAFLMVSDHTTLSHHVTSLTRRQALRWTIGIFYPLADVRVATSEGAADDLAGLSGISREKFEVIYNPVMPPQDLSSSPQVEQLWGDAGYRIISVGSLNPAKNQALLLRAFAQLREVPKAKLMILGEGPLRQMLEELAKELGLAGRVLMPGFEVDPWPYLASADLFVLTSNFEGFGIALVEAMYTGLRVVSTACQGGPREILDGGAYGRLVPCGDAGALAKAIEQSLAAPVDRQRLQDRADSLTGPPKLARYAELLENRAG